MIENVVQWLIPITPIITLILGYILGHYFGNLKAKKDKLLERRTELSEDVLRSISNLIDRTAITEWEKETLMKLRKFGIGALFEEEHEKVFLESMRGAIKEEFKKKGADVEDKEVDAFLEKFFLSLLGVSCIYLQTSIDETQLKLNENIMALKMYLDSNMKDELREKADKLNKYFEKFRGNEKEYFQLRDKASEFAEKIYEIMKF
jgi:transposase-like protein